MVVVVVSLERFGERENVEVEVEEKRLDLQSPSFTALSSPSNSHLIVADPADANRAAPASAASVAGLSRVAEELNVIEFLVFFPFPSSIDVRSRK